MWDVIVGLLIIVFGIGICFAGLRVFLIALPIWGFMAGFWSGAAVTAWIFGDNFLGTITGIIAGFVIGLVFAALSYFYWYFSVAFLCGAVGASLGTGIFEAIGIDSKWILIPVALVVGAVFVIAAMILDLPAMLIMINTSLAGAMAILAGVLLVFNSIDRKDLGGGTAIGIVQESWFWLIVWAVLAAVGIGAQMRTSAEMEAQLRAAQQRGRLAAA